MLAGGCDRQSGDAAQPQASGTAAAPAGGAVLSGVLDRSQAGAPLPAITVADPDGKTLDMASLKGQPVLVNLWATWCAPCVAELPMLGKLAVERVGELDVVLVSQDAQTGKVPSFLAAHGVPQFEAWLDPDSDLSFHYGTGTLPTTVLYDAQGEEVWRYVGANDWSSAETAKILDEALGAE